MIPRLALGAWTSLLIATGGIIVGFAIGGTLGLIAGYFGGKETKIGAVIARRARRRGVRPDHRRRLLRGGDRSRRQRSPASSASSSVRSSAGSRGYRNGDVDTYLTGIFNVLLSVPAIVLALAISAFLLGSADQAAKGGGIPPEVALIIAIGIVTIPLIGRISRASALSWSQREFVLAARAQGAKNGRIMVREVLPNVLPAMFSIALLGIAIAIVAEGALAILGVGVRAPTPSWGNIIALDRGTITKSPHIVFEASILIFLTVLVAELPRRRRASALRRAGGRAVTDARFADAPAEGTLLEVTDVKTYFQTDRGLVRSVDGVTFTLERGKTLGVVGESGSGKTVLSRSIMGLLPRRNLVREGSIRFEGTEIIDLSDRQMRDYWGAQMSMVFQDPMTSLNPVMKIGNQITESIRQHLDVSKDFAHELAENLLASVRIPEPAARLKEYPHQLSGGMRQRVCIAVALACGPKLLFADEPTTALDVTVQAQVLDLMAQQQRERFMAMVLITHDLGVVAGRADEIAVMYAGRIVEKASTSVLFSDMKMPYTEALLSSIPKLGDRSHTTAGDDPRPPTRPREPADRLQVRAAVRVRAGSVPGGGAAAPGRDARARVPLLVPGRHARGRRGARAQQARGHGRRRGRAGPGEADRWPGRGTRTCGPTATRCCASRTSSSSSPPATA